MVVLTFCCYIIISAFVYAAEDGKLDPSVYYPQDAEAIKPFIVDSNSYLIKDWSFVPSTEHFPYQARIFLNDDDNSYIAVCVIVNPQYCLTLGSVFSGNLIERYEIIAFYDGLSKHNGLSYEIKNVIFAPNFDTMSDKFDLAVVEVNHLFKYLVFQFINTDSLYINSPEASSLYVVAHGSSEVGGNDIAFVEFLMTLIDNGTCSDQQESEYKSNDMICTRPVTDDTSIPCYLDYGAGLYSNASTVQGSPSTFRVVYGLVEDVFCYYTGLTVYKYLPPYKGWIFSATRMSNHWWERPH